MVSDGRTVTSLATEMGCPYGKRLTEITADIRTKAQAKYDGAQTVMSSDMAEKHQFIGKEAMQNSADAEERLGDVNSLEQTLTDCVNCHGEPENALLSNDSCPVAQYAVYRMTLPGNRKLGTD